MSAEPGAGQSAKIFISYRRDDSAAFTGRVYDRLRHEFGHTSVFMDVDNIGSGAHFVKTLNEEVAKCGVLLAIIGPRWLSACDEDGHRRPDSTNDFVRIEIATALNRGITVIPILCDGMQVPKANQLPDDLKALATRNGLHVRNDAFHVDMDRLILELKEASIDSNGYDVSIAYCRGDGTPLAKWLKWRLQKFVLPDKIPRVIPPHRKTVYDRGPSIFLDTSVELSDEWLQTQNFSRIG